MQREESELKAQEQQQLANLLQNNEDRKREAIFRLEQEAKQQELGLKQQFGNQLMGMTQELQNRKMALEKQANDLIMEYQQRKAQEEMLMLQYQARLANGGAAGGFPGQQM